VFSEAWRQVPACYFGALPDPFGLRYAAWIPMPTIRMITPNATMAAMVACTLQLSDPVYTAADLAIEDKNADAPGYYSGDGEPESQGRCAVSCRYEPTGKADDDDHGRTLPKLQESQFFFFGRSSSGMLPTTPEAGIR